MFKKINRKNKKGFTLAELLIVVAIVGVLVAVSIPIFTQQLEKSREATDEANIRSAYAEQVAAYLGSDNTTSISDIKVPVKQRMANWQTNANKSTITIAEGKSGGGITVTARTSGNYVVKVDKATGAVTVE